MGRKSMKEYERRWDKTSRVWIYRHREVMEEHLGRKLSSKEHVHHTDGNIKNNDISNLELTSASSHCKIHNPSSKRQNVRKLCMIDKCSRRHHAKGFCKKHYANHFPEKQYGKYYGIGHR